MWTPANYPSPGEHPTDVASEASLKTSRLVRESSTHTRRSKSRSFPIGALPWTTPLEYSVSFSPRFAHGSMGCRTCFLPIFLPEAAFFPEFFSLCTSPSREPTINPVQPCCHGCTGFMVAVTAESSDSEAYCEQVDLMRTLMSQLTGGPFFRVRTCNLELPTIDSWSATPPPLPVCRQA